MTIDALPPPERTLPAMLRRGGGRALVTVGDAAWSVRDACDTKQH